MFIDWGVWKESFQSQFLLTIYRLIFRLIILLAQLDRPEVISRPGRSQGLLYKHRSHSITNSVSHPWNKSVQRCHAQTVWDGHNWTDGPTTALLELLRAAKTVLKKIISDLPPKSKHELFFAIVLNSLQITHKCQVNLLGNLGAKASYAHFS